MIHNQTIVMAFEIVKFAHDKPSIDAWFNICDSYMFQRWPELTRTNSLDKRITVK